LMAGMRAYVYHFEIVSSLPFRGLIVMPSSSRKKMMLLHQNPKLREKSQN
jgi:hypothetical protein